jgi:hypothetical protein
VPSVLAVPNLSSPPSPLSLCHLKTRAACHRRCLFYCKCRPKGFDTISQRNGIGTSTMAPSKGAAATILATCDTTWCFFGTASLPLQLWPATKRAVCPHRDAPTWWCLLHPYILASFPRLAIQLRAPCPFPAPSCQRVHALRDPRVMTGREAADCARRLFPSATSEQADRAPSRDPHQMNCSTCGLPLV